MIKTIPAIPDSAPFNAEQRAWLNGFLAGLFSEAANSSVASLPKNEKPALPLLVMFGSQTGSAEGLAKRIGAEAIKKNFAARVLDMNGFATVDWKSESRLLVVTSTWGDGDPPDNAVGFWNFLNSDAAPSLSHLNFSVLALGDKNYADFCGAGKKFDSRLEQLGAKRIHPHAECDVDYESPAKAWIDEVLQKALECGDLSPASAPEVSASKSADKPAQSTVYSRQNPFPGRLLTNKKLNAADSSKDTRHFEISLNGSDLNYEVGDALGVVPQNSPTLVQEMLAALNFDGEEAVRNGNPTEMPLRKALLEHFEIRQISTVLLEAFAERSKDSTLRELLDPKNKSSLEKFLFGREIIDLSLAYPGAKFSPQEFVSLLRKLNPRLYSISSSPKAHPGEAHLTVAAVRYEAHGRKREGVCSTFLADRVATETPVGVFVQTSHGFRLPTNSDAPIIMIGPGTGIAPFRAFLEERREIGARGKNWLFFGDQRRDADFLYREQLESMQTDGFLNRFETAFSRDQAEKIYVQNRILEKAMEVWDWLESGAHVYVCGDAKRMAKDVDVALHQVIQTAGGKSTDQAADYVQKMKTEKRYQRDVY